jgi:hypothetical protein
MSLHTIAENMKRRAHAQHGVEIVERLPHDAPPEKQVKVKLKYQADPSMPYEFRLQIQRVGELPEEGTDTRGKWDTELATFARYFGVPSNLEWTMQPGRTTYAAFVRWFDEEEMARDWERWLETIHAIETDPIARAVGILPQSIAIAKRERRIEMSDTIHMQSGVSGFTGDPFITLDWGENHAQFTPEEARAHAFAILETAEAAESDAFMFKFAIDKANQTPERAALMLTKFREGRQPPPVIPDAEK